MPLVWLRLRLGQVMSLSLQEEDQISLQADAAPLRGNLLLLHSPVPLTARLLLKESWNTGGQPGGRLWSLPAGSPVILVAPPLPHEL